MVIKLLVAWSYNDQVFKGTTVRRFFTDHLGSTVALTDASGAITSSTNYDSFGNAASSIGSAASGTGSAASSSIATTYRYTGREYDPETGLYYYRNRWYDPETGRFISKDPIGFAGGDINLYGYVGNNPLSFIDPLGKYACRSRKDKELDKKQSNCSLDGLIIPKWVSIKKNIKRAEKHKINVKSVFKKGLYGAYKNVDWFYNMVRNAKGRVNDVRTGKSWDYKQLGSEYENFGNFNYGATGGAVGFSLRMLKREAGRASLAAMDEDDRKKYEELWGTPGSRLNPDGGTSSFGDDPKDQKWIERGFRYYKYCYLR